MNSAFLSRHANVKMPIGKHQKNELTSATLYDCWCYTRPTLLPFVDFVLRVYSTSICSICSDTVNILQRDCFLLKLSEIMYFLCIKKKVSYVLFNLFSAALKRSIAECKDLICSNYLKINPGVSTVPANFQGITRCMCLMETL